MLFAAIKDSHGNFRSLAALGTEKQNVGYLYRRLFLNDAALGICLVRLHMFFDDVDLLDNTGP